MKTTLDHALIYCEFCRTNRLGVIRDGGQAECKVCGSRKTSPAQRQNVWRLVGMKAKRK